MVVDIVRMVAQTIGDVFPDTAVHTEHMPQGFKTPAFFIEAVSPKMHAGLDNRYVMSVPLYVRYYCGDSDAQVRREEGSRVSMALYAALEYIGDDVKLRGTHMGHCMEEDGGMRFEVTYRVRLLRTRDETRMGAADFGLGVRY